MLVYGKNSCEEILKQEKNISPGRFLDVFVGYLHIQKNQEIFF